MSDSPDIFCPECGYELRGIESARCPECGWEIERAGPSRLAWTYRADIGRWRAYWRTVWAMMWHVKRVAAEVARPVQEADARRFATVTAMLVGLPMAIGLLVLMAVQGGTGFLNPLSATTPAGRGIGVEMSDVTVPFAAGVTRYIVLPAGIVLTAWLITRATPIWFLWASAHLPEERRRRAEALSYYATAPLALLPIVAFTCFTMLVSYAASGPAAGGRLLRTDIIYLLITAGGTTLVVMLTWLNTLRLTRQTLHASGLRLIATAVALPATWALCAGVGLIVMPWVAGLIWMMVDSVVGF